MVWFPTLKMYGRWCSGWGSFVWTGFVSYLALFASISASNRGYSVTDPIRKFDLKCDGQPVTMPPNSYYGFLINFKNPHTENCSIPPVTITATTYYPGSYGTEYYIYCNADDLKGSAQTFNGFLNKSNPEITVTCEQVSCAKTEYLKNQIVQHYDCSEYMDGDTCEDALLHAGPQIEVKCSQPP